MGSTIGIWNLDFGIPLTIRTPIRMQLESHGSPRPSLRSRHGDRRYSLIQGDDDRNVQFAQTVNLAAALRTQGVYFEQHVFPDEIHDFLLHRNWVTAYTLAADFFNRKLVAIH